MSRAIALVGGRGYTGGELLGLVAAHPGLQLSLASSGSKAGKAVFKSCPQWPDQETRFVALDQLGVADHQADAWVLAVPNGFAQSWAEAIHSAHPQAVILDLSADHRFDAAWVYGLPERNREQLRRAKKIANPGCYATGSQMGLLPLLELLLGTPTVFGVSGYSGAGKTPSPRNDPQRLADNIVPYALSGHIHEREITHQLGRDVRFMPHVAGFLRGISLTISVRLDRPVDAEWLLETFTRYYQGEERVALGPAIPEIRQVAGTPDVLIGGFSVDERDASRVSLVVVLDNLAKGAASQAMQNLNLALGMDEHTGIDQ